jgi:uncharacterized protein (DUF736 family)
VAPLAEKSHTEAPDARVAARPPQVVGVWFRIVEEKQKTHPTV